MKRRWMPFMVLGCLLMILCACEVTKISETEKTRDSAVTPGAVQHDGEEADPPGPGGSAKADEGGGDEGDTGGEGEGEGGDEGGGEGDEGSGGGEGEDTRPRRVWLIEIEQKNQDPLNLPGGFTLPAENTIFFVAVHVGMTPYDGEFKGYAKIESHTDIQEAFDVEETIFFDMKSRHISDSFSFMLVENEDLAPLEDDSPLVPLTDSPLDDLTEAEFFMPTKGDNPASFSGLHPKTAFGTGDHLDLSVPCTLVQTYEQVKLETDFFGSFTGRIRQAGDDEFDLTDLPDASLEALLDKYKADREKDD